MLARLNQLIQLKASKTAKIRKRTEVARGVEKGGGMSRWLAGWLMVACTSRGPVAVILLVRPSGRGALPEMLESVCRRIERFGPGPAPQTFCMQAENQV